MFTEAMGEIKNQLMGAPFGMEAGLSREGYVVQIWRPTGDDYTANVLAKRADASFRRQTIIKMDDIICLKEGKNDDEFEEAFGEVAGYRALKTKGKPLCH